MTKSPGLYRGSYSLPIAWGRYQMAMPAGSSTIDHSSVLPRSIRRTFICWVAPSMSTRPKNWRPALGGRFTWPSAGALTKRSSGPNVASSLFGPKVPACSGPDTNSQKGSKFWNTALFGS